MICTLCIRSSLHLKKWLSGKNLMVKKPLFGCHTNSYGRQLSKPSNYPERIAVPESLRTPKQLESEATGDELLEKYGLRRGEYLHYPANFWQHKNHAMLLTAFKIYRKANPDSELKLLCTGSPGRGADDFCEAARHMGLSDWVVYPGYLTPEEYDFLLGSAFAMIFPSLYEGFGIPLLEAMSAGVPVLCSNVTSLPEVGGDAVLYFDPRKPAEIINALTRLSEEANLQKSLIAKGLQRRPL
jgi:glycosyltransferase involved in cell wall biosynthesis